MTVTSSNIHPRFFCRLEHGEHHELVELRSFRVFEQRTLAVDCDLAIVSKSGFKPIDDPLCFEHRQQLKLKTRLYVLAFSNARKHKVGSRAQRVAIEHRQKLTREFHMLKV